MKIYPNLTAQKPGLKTHTTSDASSAPTGISVRNPWSHEIVATVESADLSLLNQAIEDALAFQNQARRIPAHDRATLLDRAALALTQHHEELTQLIVEEAGKPITMAKAEVDRSILTFQFAAAEARCATGVGLPIDASASGENHFGYLSRVPIGLILAITPFNFPLNLVAHKVAPCLATGNTMLLKPAPKTPGAAMRLIELLRDVGMNPAQVQVLHLPLELLPHIYQNDQIKMVSFTGSMDVGWSIKTQCPRKQVTLELGGNAAAILHADSDWKSAVPMLCKAAFGFAGQSCISVQRILLHESIADEATDALLRYTLDSINTDDPSNPDTLVGPVIDAPAAERIVSWVKEAQANGASLLTPLQFEKPNRLHPLLIDKVQPGMKILDEEIFGPVAVIQRYASIEEAISMVNQSRFGIHAALFTRSIDLAWQAYRDLECAGVLINQVPSWRVENLPYGGVKNSGTGREGLRYAMEEMTVPRHLVIHLPKS